MSSKNMFSQHDENMQFLKVSYKGKKELTGHEELCDWYFGNRERSIEICAHRAYRDFCRRLTGISKNKPKKKNDWRKEEEELIAEEVEKILNNLPIGKETFDEWHKKLCNKIITKFIDCEINLKEGTEFKYGLAQKWVNMTLKNMIVMEKWDQEMNALIEYLHVPVDNYIMEAASEDFNILFLNKYSGKYGEYNSNVTKPWSKWDFQEYEKFQIALRGQIDSPIIWEGPAWLKINNKRTKK